MDYEKKYKEALKMAKGIIRYYKEHNRSDEAAIEDLEGIFPELKESEDEKIRKEIIKLVTFYYGSSLALKHTVSKDDMISWLKKQKITASNENIEKMRNAAIQACQYMVDNFENSTKQYEDAIVWLEKQGEKKSAWSEEDEEHIDSLLKRLDGLCRNEFERTRFAISEDKDWLKSLKQRIGG